MDQLKLACPLERGELDRALLAGFNSCLPFRVVSHRSTPTRELSTSLAIG
jgi:hypothetical protein